MSVVIAIKKNGRNYMAVDIFFNRRTDDGWYIENCFEEFFGLHLIYELGFDIENEEDFATVVEKAFNELLEPRTTNALRPFLHYFED